MHSLLSSSNAQRLEFAELCRELEAREKNLNGYDLVTILVDNRKARNGGNSESTSASCSIGQVPLEHANTGGPCNRLWAEREVLTDDASVSGDEDSTSSGCNSAAAFNDLYSKGGGSDSRRRYMDEVREAIVERAADVGFIIESKFRLPWKRLPELCAQHGVYIDNYPDGVVSPFGNERKACNHGIKSLTNGERGALLRALMNENNHPMRFKSERSPSDILKNRQPVIVYAPPPSGSPYERSKRIFLDWSYDYQGHPRIGTLPARKRCLENPFADKPDKRRRLYQEPEIQSPQPIVRTLAPAHPTTSTAETHPSVELSDDFLRTMEGRIFNYIFTYAERTMHGKIQI